MDSNWIHMILCISNKMVNRNQYLGMLMTRKFIIRTQNQLISSWLGKENIQNSWMGKSKTGNNSWVSWHEVMLYLQGEGHSWHGRIVESIMKYFPEKDLHWTKAKTMEWSSIEGKRQESKVTKIKSSEVPWSYYSRTLSYASMEDQISVLQCLI